jgi:NAD(P)-dependent dehydrogenase (short-subunit alcohol dehydrogenase family)
VQLLGHRDEGMSERTTALVTGANKGIGYEIAAGLGALGWAVGVGARDTGRREAAVEKLRAAGVDAFGVPFDVTDDASVAAAARLVEERAGRLDVLVNNAGITGGSPQEPSRVDPAVLRTVVETNVIGVVRVTNAMLPLLRRSASPRIVNVSSSVGSLTRQSDPHGETWADRGRLLAVEDVPERCHRPVRQGVAGHEHPDQRRLPGFHRHRPQRVPRRAYP